ncbi:MAG: 50S ribosome-binding GTPase [candidate division Zixibacteria bacterium]|nr:50S ribosome-binding GTPase [candidate division Zixibacteria bacterium]MBU1471578.1 50S ribosome-binding GTPase [candidate division Zixibacteria bacterium]MBU2624824.1 50S ribosome-binding GTPase [candidate division Zixibacteria bacterium]
MRIRNFQAETVSEALGLVKRELGSDAIILKTTPLDARDGRNHPGGRVFQVTACVDDGTISSGGVGHNNSKSVENVASAESISEVMDILRELQKDVRYLAFAGKTCAVGERISEHLTPHYINLVDQDIDATLAESILADIEKSEIDLTDEILVRSAIISEISERLTEPADVKLYAGKATSIALIGPPGSGKSSLTAKVASHFLFKKKTKVTLSTLDDFKPSASDELKRFADILKIPCVSGAPSHRDLASAGIVLIDTPGIPVGAVSERDSILEKLDRLSVDEIWLVFPAYCRWQDLRRWHSFFKPVGITATALTFLDQTHVYGSAINLSILEKVRFSFFSTGRASAADLQVANMKNLAGKVVGTIGVRI